MRKGKRAVCRGARPAHQRCAAAHGQHEGCLRASLDAGKFCLQRGEIRLYRSGQIFAALYFADRRRDGPDLGRDALRVLSLIHI